ncbi:hypothetical protein [uncultured Bacteroides sp.]|uniref:hypothetical protein n=1 Tax=uncultured Bacteroides sp. TaxID=162156 RepID=UPI002604E618|nr:hypothetical protein [uncultured Bacteroides sp.]
MKLHNIILPLTATLLLVSACTDTSVPGPQSFRTRHIYTQALSGSDSLPQTRIAFDDNEKEGMATRWETTDAFKGYYTTPQVQQVLQTTETVALFSYAEPSLSSKDNQARFEADVADDVDATTVFNFFYPSWRTSGLTWADTRASLQGQKQQGNASTAHLSLYNYLHATGVTDIEHAPEAVAFSPLLALLRFDLTLEGYDATRDGLPQRFSLQSEDEQPFYHSIQANGQGLEASSYLDLQLQDIDPTTSATDGLPANTLRLYCATAPTTLHPALLSLNVYCSNGARYTAKVNATADATVSWQAGIRYRTETLVLTRQADDAAVSVFDNSTQASASFSGSGTQTDPYLIASAGDLKLLIQQVSEQGNKYSGKYFKLTTDLRIEADTWTPIGLRTGEGSWDDNNRPFCAHFDGNGHIISGKLNGSGIYFGLFGLAGVGFGLSNLHLRADVSNNYPYNNVARAVSTGGLLGCLEASGSNPIRIQGCTFSGTLSSAAGGNNVGGLVGMATSSLNMTGCINRGNLSATNNTGSPTNLSQNLGGLVGFAKGTVSLSDCANYGSFSTTNVKDYVYAGGLLGQVATNATIQLRNTDNYADVFPAANSNAKVGGLVGWADNGQLHTSTNHATLTTGSGTRGSLIGSKGGSLTVNDCCTDQGNTGLPLCADPASTQPCDEKHRKGL